MSQLVLEQLQQQFGPAIRDTHAHRGDETAIVQAETLHEVCRFLKTTPTLDCNLLLDICGADYPNRAERFEVIYHLYSIRHGHRIRLKVPLSGSEPVLRSVMDLWVGADWFERECYDLFGINFLGHPNLKRLLTFDEFEGHPLRKDYPVNRRPKIPTPDPLLYGGVGQDRSSAPDDNAFDGGLHTHRMCLNLGPSHPTMHGTLRVLLTLDGETIVDAYPEIGYLHRCFEKESEDHTYTQIIPYTDRLNYLSPLMNNVGYAMAVEKLMGIEIPRRAQYIRVIISELQRIMDHLVCVGTNLVDLGALTNFWYFFNVRELMYVWVEALTGARLTNTYTRIGGVARDLPEGFAAGVRQCLKDLHKAVKDVVGLIRHNKIFLDRTRDVGVISGEDAVAYGFTGPCLRASGVAYDVRKAHPYCGYEAFDFDVPIGQVGDSYERIMVRIEEIHQSARIVEQALATIPDGPIINPEGHTALPPKHEVYNSIEGLIRHFELIMFGVKPPAGEAYGYTEAANGELGFYIVSDGSGKPYRIKVRPPCFAIYQAYPHLIKGSMIADAVAVLGNLNIVAGELDR